MTARVARVILLWLRMVEHPSLIGYIHLARRRTVWAAKIAHMGSPVFVSERSGDPVALICYGRFAAGAVSPGRSM